MGHRGPRKEAQVEPKELARHILLGETEAAAQWSRQAVDAGMDPQAIINQGLLPGMAEVGTKFKNYEYYLPEVLVAGKAMNACLAILKPLLTDTDTAYVGRVVIGTVQGDLHDIGKNLVVMMLEGAGFAVNDLGSNVYPEQFVQAVQDENPDLVCLSTLLTTTMPRLQSTLAALEAAELRHTVKVMVGGAPVSQDYADEIGADGYAPESASAVETAKAILGIPASTG
jgi:5-methyltetrahydrofolate--homocysteine methyltransferase